VNKIAFEELQNSHSLSYKNIYLIKMYIQNMIFLSKYCFIFGEECKVRSSSLRSMGAYGVCGVDV
jgi:hypothetical protein